MGQRSIRCASWGLIAGLWGGVFLHGALGQPSLLADSKVPDPLLIKMETLEGVQATLKERSSLWSTLQELGVSRLEKAFRQPPRGWRDEGAAERLGLDLWLVATFEHERENVGALAERLDLDPSVRLCEQDVIGTASSRIPNDPDFVNQYSLQSGLLNAPEAWDILRDSDVVVAVIDSGADLDHEDLVDNLWTNPGEIPGNGLDDDQNGYVDDHLGWDFIADDNDPDDEAGHGVHCCGVIGAKTNNDRQVSGICWSASIMVVRNLNAQLNGSTRDAANSIVYATDNGASVLSNSYGFANDTSILKDAIDYAVANDAVIVAAAHNFAQRVDVYPAAYPEVMGVIATNPSDEKATFSNWGPWYDISAPGVRILNLGRNNGTRYMSGTSMATPHVAGAAALVRTLNPSLDAVDTRWILSDSAKDIGDTGYDECFGWGRLDIYAALQRASRLSISTNVASPGDAVTLQLHHPHEPNFVHLLLPSLHGRSPGMPIDAVRHLRLNFDPLLMPFVLAHPSHGAGVFLRFFESFDPQGRETATFSIPSGPMFSGTSVSFATVSFDPSQLDQVTSTSGSVRLRIQ